MKKIYYHQETNTWVRPIKKFDDDSFFVVKWNENALLNAYVLRKNDLCDVWGFLKKLAMGELRKGLHRDILYNIKNSPSVTFKERAKILKMKEDELKDEVFRLNKMGLVDFDGSCDYPNIELTPKGKSITSIKKKVNPRKIKPALTLFFILFFSNLSYSPQLTESIIVKPKTFYEMVENRKEYIENKEFDFDLFIEYLDLIGVKNKGVVLSQAVLETNTFNSDIFKENNNLFGMKQPSIRPTTVIGTNRGHAIYNHWTCSVQDYKLWYEYMTRNESYVNYFRFLADMGYAEDPHYLSKLQIIKQELIKL